MTNENTQEITKCLVALAGVSVGLLVNSSRLSDTILSLLDTRFYSTLIPFKLISHCPHIILILGQKEIIERV